MLKYVCVLIKYVQCIWLAFTKHYLWCVFLLNKHLPVNPIYSPKSMKLQILVINKVKKPFGVWFMPLLHKTHAESNRDDSPALSCVNNFGRVFVESLFMRLHPPPLCSPSFLISGGKCCFVWAAHAEWKHLSVLKASVCTQSCWSNVSFLLLKWIFSISPHPGSLILFCCCFFLCPMLHLQGDLVSNPSVGWLT